MIENKKFKKGQIISNEGDFELWMYYIVSGKVGIYGGYNTEHRVVLSVNERCSFFGELGFLESLPRYGTSVALEDTEVEIITHDNFTEFFNAKPQRIMAIMSSLSAKVRDMYRLYMSSCNTIDEYLEAEQSGKKKSQGLMKRMHMFSYASKRINEKSKEFLN